MLRTKEQRELDREFTQIETWEEFLGRWRAVSTEQEAVGLLYTGTTVSWQDRSRCPYPTFEEVETRVNFYLRWANHKNTAIQTTAQQLLIKHWLRKVHMQAVFVEIHRNLLNFLAHLAEDQTEILKSPFKPDAPLLKPPYPRFVSEYLLKMYEVWHHAYQQERDHAAFQALTEPLVVASCFWGVSYLFARDGNGKSAIPIIEKFLKSREYEPGNVFMKLSGYGDPLADLSCSWAQEEAKERAALALLKMRYWFAGGVKEKFENRFFPHYED